MIEPSSSQTDDDCHPAPPIRNRSLLFSIFLFGGTILLAVVFHWWRTHTSSLWFEIGFILSASAVISVLISEACEPFSDAAQWIGHRLRLPPSVRGATLDAIASSMPELFTGLFFVAVAVTGEKEVAQRMLDSAEGYGSTIATCAGSSIYNLVLIPAICAIAIARCRPQRPYIRVARELVNRDGAWVIATQLGLLLFLFQPELDWWMGVVAILAYAGYVLHLYLATRRYRHQLASGEVESETPDETAMMFFKSYEVRLNGISSTLILVVSALVAAIACYLLVDLTNESAHKLGVSPFFIAVILTAAVSSIPDTLLSLGSARRGDDAGAVSNVFGSNIFDICIGMSIPLLVSCYLNGWEPIRLVGPEEETLQGVVGLRLFLFVLTAVVMVILWRTERVTRGTGWFFCLLYASFVVYAVLGALGIVTV